MKLGKNEYCPIHHSRSCRGREQMHKEHRLRLGVQRIEDPHHPREYRELRGEMTTLHAPIAVTSVGANEGWDRERRTRVRH